MVGERWLTVVSRLQLTIGLFPLDQRAEYRWVGSDERRRDPKISGARRDGEGVPLGRITKAHPGIDGLSRGDREREIGGAVDVDVRARRNRALARATDGLVVGDHPDVGSHTRLTLVCFEPSGDLLTVLQPARAVRATTIKKPSSGCTKVLAFDS
jgi:hypothetical protein